MSKSVEEYEPITSKTQCCANELFTIGKEENNDDCFPLNILNLQREQQKELIKVNDKLSA